MKRVVLLATAALLAPAAAGAQDLTGHWKFQGTGPQGAANALTCTLAGSGANITGSCLTPQGSTVDVTGTVTGNQVEIGYNVGASTLRISFKGVIQADGSIQGTVQAATPPAPFVGSRQ